jgi:hypothetical protein
MVSTWYGVLIFFSHSQVVSNGISQVSSLLRSLGVAASIGWFRGLVYILYVRTLDAAVFPSVHRATRHASIRPSLFFPHSPFFPARKNIAEKTHRTFSFLLPAALFILLPNSCPWHPAIRSPQRRQCPLQVLALHLYQKVWEEGSTSDDVTPDVGQILLGSWRTCGARERVGLRSKA